MKVLGEGREELGPLSAVILQHETLYQTNKEGKPIIQVQLVQGVHSVHLYTMYMYSMRPSNRPTRRGSSSFRYGMYSVYTVRTTHYVQHETL